MHSTRGKIAFNRIVVVIRLGGGTLTGNIDIFNISSKNKKWGFTTHLQKRNEKEK